MIRTISLVSAVLIFLLMLVLVFENLFFGQATYYILFWEFSGSVSGLILGTFILGAIFGTSVFLFFSENSLEIEQVEDLSSKGKEWE